MKIYPPSTRVPFPVEKRDPGFGDLLRSFLLISGLRIKLWEDALFVLIDLPVVQSEVKKILPLFMRPADPCRATLFVARYPKTAFTGDYNEAALLIHVKTPLGRGVHCPWMLVDDDTAMIYGREALGYPKKMADIPFDDDGRRIQAAVSRRGKTVVSVDLERLEPESAPGPVLQMKTFNIGAMGQFFAVNPVWFFIPRETIHESWKARATLELNDSDYDPIARLVADHENPLDARVARIDIMGARPMLPVWCTGLRVFKNTFNLRYR